MKNGKYILTTGVFALVSGIALSGLLPMQRAKAEESKENVLIIYAINIIFSSVTIFYVLGNRYIAMGLYGFLMVILLFLVIRTDILFDHSSKESNKKKIKLIRKKK